MMMVITSCHSFSGAFERLQRVCLPSQTSIFHTMLSLPLNCVHFSFLCIFSGSVSLSGNHIIDCISELDPLFVAKYVEISQQPVRMTVDLTYFCCILHIHNTHSEQVHLSGSVCVRASLDCCQGLSCQDLTCLPEDKAVTGG